MFFNTLQPLDNIVYFSEKVNLAFKLDDPGPMSYKSPTTDNFILLPDSNLDFLNVLFFSGVNMYAMLTGTLPFTVEPFSLRALYQKMVDKSMNPLPSHLSPGKQCHILETIYHQTRVSAVIVASLSHRPSRVHFAMSLLLHTAVCKRKLSSANSLSLLENACNVLVGFVEGALGLCHVGLVIFIVSSIMQRGTYSSVPCWVLYC